MKTSRLDYWAVLWVCAKEDARTGHQELSESAFAEEQGRAAGVEYHVACIGEVDAGAFWCV